MQTIGERFEDMRKRKGVSLREAAEATKIRGDYLQKFENNQFDIGLSEIYVRGFLRSYSSYLRLPVDRVLNDYSSLGHDGERPRISSREAYGRMDLSISKEDGVPAAPDSGVGEASHAPKHVPRSRSVTITQPKLTQAQIFKGLIAAGILLAVFLVFLLGKALFGGSSPAPAVHTPAAAPIATSPAPAPEPMVGLIALDAVRIKVVRQSDNAELFQGQLERGERREFPNVPLMVTSTSLESVQIEYKGKHFAFGKKGYGRLPLDTSLFP